MVRWDAVLWPHTSTSPPPSAVTPSKHSAHIKHPEVTQQLSPPSGRTCASNSGGEEAAVGR